MKVEVFMEIFKWILMGLPSILLLAIGISIKYGKAYWLISGYNTMSSEKKKNVNVEQLGKRMGDFCIFLAVLIFLIIMSLVFELFILTVIGAVLFISGIIIFIIKAQKYDGNAVKENGKMKVNTKFAIGGIAAFFVILSIGVGFLLYQGNRSVAYVLSADGIQISGMYGETIAAGDILDVAIQEDLPEITLRTNGSAIGSKLKGFFNVTGYGNAKLFLDTKTPPYIFIRTAKKTIILNDGDRAKTEALYQSIRVLKGE